MKHSIRSLHERSRFGFGRIKRLRSVGFSCIAGFILLVSLASAQNASDNENDPDLPRFATGVSKQEYLGLIQTKFMPALQMVVYTDHLMAA